MIARFHEESDGMTRRSVTFVGMSHFVALGESAFAWAALAGRVLVSGCWSGYAEVALTGLTTSGFAGVLGIGRGAVRFLRGLTH